MRALEQKGRSLMKDQDGNTAVRKYRIGGTTYIVKASVRAGAAEDAVKMIRRLIREDIRKERRA